MKVITINIPDEVADDLQEEAQHRHLSLEQVVAERVLQPSLSTRAPKHVKTKPARLHEGLDGGAIIGLFADKPGFVEVVEAVVAEREDRYSPSK